MFQVEGKACAKALSLVCSRGRKSINTPGAQLTNERVAPGSGCQRARWARWYRALQTQRSHSDFVLRERDAPRSF